ncbi:EamA-like transporter family protein [Aquimixticola soesokkakensis]|uniref:EamA-like transporter family protein n=1 Tax=Aquimixticola soesokkakensis TaxID=1519096 RepID=A0A1Y5R6G6_9RHOB|nr:DMT family transporter [Aquimixticola soesokkakensis]SLN10347.1 EamA-like transporter family protein [Aquimixticola soesokkakensis]
MTSATASLTSHNPLRGILLKVASVSLFVIMASMIKAARVEVPAGEAVFFRSLLAIPVVLVWVAIQGDMGAGLRVNSVTNHIWRGVIGTSAMMLGFFSLGLLPLPEVTAIGYASPLLLVIFAAMFMGETVRLVRFSAVLIGLVGVIIVLSPRLTVIHGVPTVTEQLGAVVALGAAVLAAIVQLHVRNMVRSESVSAIAFWFFVTASAVSLCSLPFGGWVVPSPKVMALLVASGLIGGFGQVFLTACYRYADASLIAPFEYVSMILALGIGYVAFGEVPTLPMMSGAVVIIAAGIFIIWRERKLGLAPERLRKTNKLF